MEDQIIRTIVPPRISFKRGLKGNNISWEIASSSSEDKEELVKIRKIIEDEIMVDDFKDKQFEEETSPNPASWIDRDREERKSHEEKKNQTQIKINLGVNYNE